MAELSGAARNNSAQFLRLMVGFSDVVTLARDRRCKFYQSYRHFHYVVGLVLVYDLDFMILIFIILVSLLIICSCTVWRNKVYTDVRRLINLLFRSLFHIVWMLLNRSQSINSVNSRYENELQMLLRTN